MGTSDRFRELINIGPKIRCSFSGQYYFKSEMKSDGNGGYMAKKFKIKQKWQKSEPRQGPGWQRGKN